ncbi:MAG: hypothetical protein LC110_13130, partial [Burkholderiales bacterium]|nr:hypothetical protein [Burkholderiales bacterium]
MCSLIVTSQCVGWPAESAPGNDLAVDAAMQELRPGNAWLPITCAVYRSEKAATREALQKRTRPYANIRMNHAYSCLILPFAPKDPEE